MMKRLFQLMGSLMMAVSLLLAIAGVLAWGTIYEARFGTASVQRFIYQSWWFEALLGFLAVNLATAAIGRYPWQRKHTPFLLAHMGIILILLGGILGGRLSVEGQMVIPEGQASQTLKLPQSVLMVRQPNPGVAHVIPTQFETTAWMHEPRVTIPLPLEGRSVSLTIDRYYPNAAVSETVSDAGASDNPAVHLTLRDQGQEDDLWLFAKDPERFGARWGEAHLLFLEPASSKEFIRLLGLSSANEPSRGTVTIEFSTPHTTKMIPVPQDFSRPISIEGTPYVLQFKDYFTDFALTEQGVANRSPDPNNPAVAFVMSGPEGADTHLLFALHPEFAAVHGRTQRIPARVSYAHPAGSTALPPNAICLIRHPNNALSCVLTDPDGNRVMESCEVGGRFRHPWLGYECSLEALYPRAVRTEVFTNRDDEVKSEALHLVAREGEASAEAWLVRDGTAQLELGAEPVLVEYRQAERALPFTIKLLDFRKTDYPGTQMASSFESDVELSDPSRDVILMRTIRMNHPLAYRGYTFYQSSYLPGAMATTVLSVKNDPGTPLVYAGFLIVIAGVVTMFVFRNPQATLEGSRSLAAAPRPEAVGSLGIPSHGRAKGTTGSARGTP